MYIFKWCNTYFFTWSQHQKMCTNQKARAPVNADLPETNKKCNESPHFSQGTVGAVTIAHVRGNWVWLKTWGCHFDHFELISQKGHSENTWNVDTFYEILVQVPVQKGDTRSVKHGMISTVKCDISTSVLVQTLGQICDICCVHSGYFTICFCFPSYLVEHPGVLG